MKVTLVAPVKAVPVIVTAVPKIPVVGEMEVTCGFTAKFAELVAVPFGVVAVILPVVAPSGTLVLICVSEITVKVAAVPLNFTAVAPVKPVPVMVTEAFTNPLVGEKELIVGAAVDFTVKLAELLSLPEGVVTLILPVVAPAGTLAVI